MPFGICSASEEFQRHINEVLEGLEGVAAIADDLLVTGAGKIQGAKLQTEQEQVRLQTNRSRSTVVIS